MKLPILVVCATLVLGACGSGGSSSTDTPTAFSSNPNLPASNNNPLPPKTVTYQGTTYTYCANQNGNCAFTGTAMVLWGATAGMDGTNFPPNNLLSVDGPYTLPDRNTYTSVPCYIGGARMNAKDPAPGYTKACWYALVGGSSGSGSGSSGTTGSGGSSGNGSSGSGSSSGGSGSSGSGSSSGSGNGGTGSGSGSNNAGCTAGTASMAASTGSLITADLVTTDNLRVYPFGSKVTINFTTAATTGDDLVWAIVDATGLPILQGSFPVKSGSFTTPLACTMPKGGYFAVIATLGTEGGSLAAAGTRPSGIVTFGILPNTTLPAPTYSASDQHRFGMQGFNGNFPALNDMGATMVPDDREQSWGEPNGPNTYTPGNDLGAWYQSNTSILRLIRLDGIPAWDSSTGQFNDSYSLPTNLTEYQQYMAKVGTDSLNILNTYYPKQRYDYYQVTWEPSLAWAYPSNNFVTLYETVYNGIHSTDSKAEVMGVGNPFANNNTQSTGTYLQQYQSAGLCNYLDGVTTHNYYNAPTVPANPPEEQDQQGSPQDLNSLDLEIRGLRSIMQGCKPNMKLWATEVGISYDNGVNYGSNKITQNQLWAQAMVAERTHIITLGEGAQLTTYFYGPDFPDTLNGYGSFFDLSDPTGAYGASNLSPKPEAMAFAALSRILDGTTTLGYLKGVPNASTGVYGYSFQQMGSGIIITALWVHQNSQWPSGGVYSQTYNTNYSLPVDNPGTNGTVTVLDAFGNPTKVSYTDGAVKLVLTESPIFVVSTNAPVMQSNVTTPVGYVGQ